MSGKYVGSNINESKPCSMLLTNHQYHALIKAQDLSLILINQRLAPIRHLPSQS